MELVKKPILRVPLVLILTGLVCRMVSRPILLLWVRIQILRGPDPATGAYGISGGVLDEIMIAIAFLLFWAAGWKFVRGLSRKEIFLSATIMVVWAGIAFLLFWAAGWKFVRGLSRKEIFLSATIMVVWAGLLLALEQLVQAYGSYSMWISRLYATTETMDWTLQILIRVFDEVSVPVVLLYIFTPYLYLLLGRREELAEPAAPEIT